MRSSPPGCISVMFGVVMQKALNHLKCKEVASQNDREIAKP